jgi:hypothetical protein
LEYFKGKKERRDQKTSPKLSESQTLYPNQLTNKEKEMLEKYILSGSAKRQKGQESSDEEGKEESK